MTDASPVAAKNSEPTTVTELENALHVIDKTIREVAGITPSINKAAVVSALYRALQNRTEEVREMRELALFDAAIDLAHESSGDKESRLLDSVDQHDKAYAFHLFLMGAQGLMYKVNRSFWLERPNGKREVLEPFSNEYEPGAIARRLYDKVVASIKSERAWEATFDKPHPHPLYPQYRDR